MNEAFETERINDRADQLVNEQLNTLHYKVDRLFAVLMVIQWVAAMLAANHTVKRRPSAPAAIAWMTSTQALLAMIVVHATTRQHGPRQPSTTVALAFHSQVHMPW